MSTPEEATDLTKLDPPEIDHLWEQAMEPAYRASRALLETRATMRRYLRMQGRVPGYLIERETNQATAYDEAMRASEPFDDEYERRGGWTRYLLVVNSNGHVHRMSGRHTSDCPSLRVGTLYRPLWRLSGRTDDEVVVELGFTACSRCFKAAPVASREDRERVSAQKRAAQQRERDEKAALKLSKAAERAKRVMVKVEAFYAAHGGMEAVMAMSSREVYALYCELPTTVGDVVHDDMARAHGGHPFHIDPRQIIREAQAKGLI